jgi:hypothetical protein
LGNAGAVIELARYQEGPSDVVVRRDGDALVFWSSYDDFGRTITEETRLPVDDFVARGEGPWPWYDLGDKREGVLTVLEALGVDPPAWTAPLPEEILNLFEQASRGSSEVIELLAWGAEPDPVDPCGATPLWYAVRSLGSGIVVALIDAGADAGRRIELSADGHRYTTILHEIVRLGRTVGLAHALEKGTRPDPIDSDGATPLHVVDANNDNTNPEMVRALVRAGAAVDAETKSGIQPIASAAQRILPATVAALVELGADPNRGLDALLAWWPAGVSFAGYRAREVADIIDILRAGGADVTDRHRESAARAGASQVAEALRR